MIEVIKNGFMPTYEIKCLGCNSILHFIDRDEIISFKKHEHMLYGDWDYYYIICPI